MFEWIVWLFVLLSTLAFGGASYLAYYVLMEDVEEGVALSPLDYVTQFGLIVATIWGAVATVYYF